MDIRSLKGVGPRKADILRSEASIESIDDLLYYIPRRYLDRSSFKSISDTFVNETVTVLGTIIDARITGGVKKRLEVIIDDGTDSLTGVFFGGIRYLQKMFPLDEPVIFSGKIQYYRGKQIVHPDFDFMDEGSRIQSINTGRIIPLYRSTEKLKDAGLDSRGFRRLVRSAIDLHLDSISEPLPDEILVRYSLPGIKNALRAIHFPETLEEAENARRRLAFNEIFFLSCYLGLSRRFVREQYVHKRIPVPADSVASFIRGLPFELTDDQKTAVREILGDLDNSWPMNRLLQGDVGSGKTVVAMVASLYTAFRGFQVAFMAPTEVLANQHYSVLTRIFPAEYPAGLLTGSKSSAERQELFSAVETGRIRIIVGTHALLEETFSFNKLGLIIIDEQHRFGVAQRAKLRAKGQDVDLLVMSATPIPRSLYMTLYGDLDISVIRTKPSNRGSVTTLGFPESRLGGVYNSLSKYIRQGRQVYYVVPLIEESEKTDLKSAMEIYEHLRTSVFPDYRIEILHGRLSRNDKDIVMERFRNHEIDILVATTVIEVGIDVPNACVIVIHHAERYGLSQLHQLRGRVGRGEFKSFCVMIYPDNLADDSMRRINIILNTDDGFAIAEEDLKLRGAGNLIGMRQHGHAGDFEFTDLSADLDIIQAAREEALSAVDSIPDVPGAIAAFEKKTGSEASPGIRTKRILALLS